jgi:hypothetical protein
MISVGVLSLERRERAGLAVRPLSLGGGDLHRLVLVLDHAELVADRQLDDDRGDQDDQRQLGGAMERIDVLSLAQVPRGHGQHHQAPCD